MCNIMAQFKQDHKCVCPSVWTLEQFFFSGIKSDEIHRKGCDLSSLYHSELPVWIASCRANWANWLMSAPVGGCSGDMLPEWPWSPFKVFLQVLWFSSVSPLTVQEPFPMNWKRACVCVWLRHFCVIAREKHSCLCGQVRLTETGELTEKHSHPCLPSQPGMSLESPQLTESCRGLPDCLLHAHHLTSSICTFSGPALD